MMLDFFAGTPVFLPWHMALVGLVSVLALLVLMRRTAPH